MSPWADQAVYSKLRYVEYTDGHFEQPIEGPQWQGILGPTLRAVEGQTIRVHFRNHTNRPVSMHPHGMHYDPASEGLAPVHPGETFTYTWHVPESAAPGPDDPSSIVWLYHSHVNPVADVYDGLIGSIIVTRKGAERSATDPRPADVDRSFVTHFMVFDEEEGAEGGLMHAINGQIFGNLEGLEAREGDRVRWHLLALGSEVDLHTAHWHGQTVLEGGKRTDVVELLPASMKTVDMIADNPGQWLYHCHVADHVKAGMSTWWRVNAN
jgi:FtsP/CotA-like multicopper oxidase with cupredoxin domain